MKRKILIGITVVIVLVIGFAILRPLYSSWKDNRIVVTLESKAIPLVNEKKVILFAENRGCEQIQYESVQAATPHGCAYIPNQTDESKKSIPDFSGLDRLVFNEIKNDLGKVPFEKFIEIIPEYPLFYRAEHAALGDNPIGTGFHIDCEFCRTRYVYWPNYQKLPPDIEGEVWYTPINKDWYRVDQDWN